MRRAQGKVFGAVLVSCAGMALAACGSSSVPEVASATPLTTGSVSFSQTGNAAAHVQAGSVTYRLDDSGSLVVTLNVISTSATPQTIAVRASLYNSSGGVVGDATGAQIQVAPGKTAPVQLNGPAPQGTIASAVFELTAVASPTPLKNTPVPGGVPSP
jgi:hypothetical protein